MASKRAIRRKSCERKRRFSTAADAHAAGRLHVYRCRFCSGFHRGRLMKATHVALNRKYLRTKLSLLDR